LARAKPAFTRSRIIRSFELGEHSAHLEHRRPEGVLCRRLLTQVEINAGRLQLREEADEVGEASAQPDRRQAAIILNLPASPLSTGGRTPGADLAPWRR